MRSFHIQVFPVTAGATIAANSRSFLTTNFATEGFLPILCITCGHLVTYFMIL